MSLLELLIAMAIFAVFGVAFMSGIGQNIFISGMNKQDAKLIELAENKINEVIIDPPQLRETLLEGKPDVNKFDNHPGYSYSVVIKKITIPDYDKLSGNEEGIGDGGETGSSTNMIKQKAFSFIKNSMEKLVWQIRVTVYHQESGLKHTLSTWIYNRSDDIRIEGGVL